MMNFLSSLIFLMVSLYFLLYDITNTASRKFISSLVVVFVLVPCLKMTLSKGLGYGIILGAILGKVVHQFFYLMVYISVLLLLKQYPNPS